MKRRILSILLALVLLAALSSVPAAAAGQDLVITQDTLLRRTGWFVLYNSITVKSGATLTIDKEFGFEIGNSLVVEPGAKLVCNGTGSVEFQFSMKYRGSTVTGVDLYYPQRWDDGTVTYERIPEPFANAWDLGVFDELSPRFKWDPDCCEGGGWCLTWSMSGNPFNIRFYHMMPDIAFAYDKAAQLNGMGLFRGVGTDADGRPVFDLERKATRAEGLVMLIRLLGKEEEALAGTWSHPFPDAGWADKYIGYAYENGLTKGKSDGTFGRGDSITAQQYMTFLLRALGYDDSDNQIYNNALTLADELKLLTRPEEDNYAVCINDFWRADMVVASTRALNTETVSGGILADQPGIRRAGAPTEEPPQPAEEMHEE